MDWKEEAEKLADKARLWNEEQFRDHGEVMPMVVIQKGEDTAMIPLPWNSERMKVAVTRAMNDTLKKMQPDIALFSSECWMAAMRKDEYAPGVRPSEHPERIEAVMILVQWKGGAILRSYPILESAGMRYLGDLIRDLSDDGSKMQLTSQMFKGVFEEVGHS
jgi:hypothetical protein